MPSFLLFVAKYIIKAKITAKPKIAPIKPPPTAASISPTYMKKPIAPIEPLKQNYLFIVYSQYKFKQKLFPVPMMRTVKIAPKTTAITLKPLSPITMKPSMKIKANPEKMEIKNISAS